MASAEYELYALRYATRCGPRQEYFQDPVDDGDRDMRMDYFVWLATGNGARVLVDTGFGADAARRRGRTWLRRPADVVRAMGVEPVDVQHVILTHLHYDHAGTVADFPNAVFHLQEREYHFAIGRDSDSTRPGFEVLDTVGLVELFYAGRLVLHNGSASPLPGIAMHLVGGHTPGTQIVTVATGRGRVVLTSDASHFYENYERRICFPHADDVERSKASFALIADLADSPDHVVPGHDPLVLVRYPAVAAERGVEGATLHLPTVV
jgi:glyoxylase-like metal-dependent hydrolase (beta-lactamase superfamily II)